MTQRQRRQEVAQIRDVARAICRVAGSASCIMDAEPDRPPCHPNNCRMIRVAMDAILAARAGGPNYDTGSVT